MIIKNIGKQPLSSLFSSNNRNHNDNSNEYNHSDNNNNNRLFNAVIKCFFY